MAFSDSLFLIEIVVEELKSFVSCKEFYIRSQFADVFGLNLKDPNDFDPLLPKKKKKKKTKVRNVKTSPPKVQKPASERKLQTGQSILFASSTETLTTNMKEYPIELSLYDKDNPENRLGSTQIPWNPIYIDYLKKLHIKEELAPARASGIYNVFDEFTSKRMASITLDIKLTYLKDKITSSFRSLSEDNQHTFVYTGFNSNPATILSTIKETPENWMENPGLIKTIYRDGKRKSSNKGKAQRKKKEAASIKTTETTKPNEPAVESTIPAPTADIGETKKRDKLKKSFENSHNITYSSDNLCLMDPNKLNTIKSDTDLDINKQVEVIKTKSCSSINKQQYNILNYIFGDTTRPFGEQVYCVGYFTIENDFDRESSKESSGKGQTTDPSEDSKPKGRFKFKVCDINCPSRNPPDGSCSESACSVDLPEEAAELITVTKCKQVECNNKVHKEVPDPPDDRILIDLKSLKKDCCAVTETVEEVTGGMQAKMKISEDGCFCSCDCRFGFYKKTAYCAVCGGFEDVGEDFVSKPPNTPFPCPVYHKLIDKGKLKTWSTSGSDSKKKGEESQKSLKVNNKPASKSVDPKNAESEKDAKKGKKKKRDDRFKFNYGYAAAQIGHGSCGAPCTGTLGAVPKRMGWLWTAEDVPGMKFRPNWRPGATNKHVVRLLRMAKNPGEVITKKKRKDAGKNKRPLKRPLLIVQKKDGEYTVTMETMKQYAKPRTLNQHPYEDKPVLTYTIGRTEQENRDRQKRKEREQRRVEREKRQFIQSAFRDMCKEICLKTYQQALGFLPETEDPECTCYPAHPGADRTNLDLSCSCSEDNKSSIGSATDDDEWIVEFTPPNAIFDPKYKGKKVVKVDNTSQYTYLDYRVKLLDRYGNPVPRFFKGPDGRNQCSDLGGFWSPDHKWLEINNDGYIAPDGRWAPMAFIGPGGEQIDCDTGKFQAANGRWLVVGVDGYVDCNGRWKAYPRPRGGVPQKKRGGSDTKKKGAAGDKKDDKGLVYKPFEGGWSCFGDATPMDLSKMGIVGHGHDKKYLLKTLREMLAHGEDVKIPQPSLVPRLPASKKGKGKRRGGGPEAYDSRTYFLERTKCRHPVPSDKGIVAVDDRGNKTYFRLKDYYNKRPKQRIHHLKQKGYSLSSFHVPCFHSFINTEMLKRQQYERLLAMSKLCFKNTTGKHVATQV